MKFIFNKFIVQIKFPPTAKFLDKKGTIADKVRQKSSFDWKISGNRIDFKDKEENISAFFSFKDYGFMTNDKMENDDFYDYFASYLKVIWDDIPTKIISRIGIRKITYIESNLDFVNLREKMSSTFLQNINNDDITSVNDIALTIEFKHFQNNINVQFGPMHKSQLKTFFSNLDEKNITNTGIFFDADYYLEEEKILKQKEIMNFLKKGVEKIDQLNKDVCEKVNS